MKRLRITDLNYSKLPREKPRNEEENQTFLSPVSSLREIKKERKKKILAQIPKTFPLLYNTAKKIRGGVEGGKEGDCFTATCISTAWIVNFIAEAFGNVRPPAPCKTAPSVFVVQRVCLIVPRWNNSISMSEIVERKEQFVEEGGKQCGH